MNEHVQRVQKALLLAGYDLGRFGADGDFGPKTADAVMTAINLSRMIGTHEAVVKEGAQIEAPALNGRDDPIPALWLPMAKMKRIIMHWTAGSYTASEEDKEHYHFLIDGSAKIIKGVHSVSNNEVIRGSNYAAHTLNCNTGSIGISICCMAGATESPFNPGNYPMKAEQFGVLIEAVAQLCEVYDIPVTPQTVLSHAEVQGNLGIQQRGKWDYTRLPFDPQIKGARAVGDHIRERVSLFV